MSMTKEALQHIQDCAQTKDVIEAIDSANTQVPLAVVPGSMNVESLELYMPNAARRRLKFFTTSTEDFILYNKDFDAEGATCFVNGENMSAKSIFDLGTVEVPGHKQSTAALTLKKTAAHRALYQINGDHLSQKQAAEFIEDWADFIKVLSKDGEEMTPKAAALALQDMTIEAAKTVNVKVGDFSESANTMESIEARTKDKTPGELAFSCLTYQGLTEKTFHLRVGILTTGEKPKVVFRILQLEAIEEEIAEEFKDKLVQAFDSCELKTYIGEA